jgi:hypothetical protein
VDRHWQTGIGRGWSDIGRGWTGIGRPGEDVGGQIMAVQYSGTVL